MLFDLRGRGRRRTIQAIYLGLAILMGGGLVFFGVGGNTNGGLLDAFKGGGGGGASAISDQLQKAEKSAQKRPSDPAAWRTLTKARFQNAGIGSNYDQGSGQFTSSGIAELRKAAQAWERYSSLDRTPDPNLAVQMVTAYASLGHADKAVGAEEIVVASQPASAGLYGRLAELAYAAGQTRKGDLAASKAVSLAPKDQRATVRDQLNQAKAQAGGAGGVTPGATTPPAATTG